MLSHNIAVEYKDRHVTRPMLDGIIGAALRTPGGVREIIVRCASASKDALLLAVEATRAGTYRSNGHPVRITIAVDVEEGK